MLKKIMIFVQRIFRNISQGLFQQFWEKAPGQNWEKMIDLTSKLGEINDIEHYKGSKIYPQNQVIAKHTTYAQVFKYHPDMVSVSHK